MKVLSRVGLGLLLAAGPCVGQSEKPLALAAEELVGRLKAGCIVTGESVKGERVLAVAGSKPEGPVEGLVFEMGSITKVFTGLLLADMVVRGEVTLETTVGDLLGRGMTFKDARVGAITLGQLATHRSGLPRLPEDLGEGAKVGDPYAHYDAVRLRRYLREKATVSEGPHGASYSNLGFGLLGFLQEQAIGRPWRELIRERICEPLGLRDTAVDPAGEGLVRAVPYAGSKRSLPWQLAALEGAGALRTTVVDLVRFGEALGAPEGGPLEAAIRLACSPHGDFSGGQIGLGIMRHQVEGQWQLNHDGGTGGFRSSLQVMPSLQTVRVVLINNSALEAGLVLARTRAQSPKAKPVEVPTPAESLVEYEGVYALDAEARFTVLKVGERLRVRLTGQPFLPVFFMGDARFFYRAVEAELQFEKEGGRATKVTLFQNGRELVAERVEAPLPAIRFRTAAELEPYAGTYALGGVGTLNVVVRGETLFAQLTDQPALPVFEEADELFRYDVVEAALRFTRDEKGEVTGVTLEQNGARVPGVKQ